MPQVNRDELDAKVEAVFEQVVAWRRHIHQHPELSNQETETAAYIEAELKKLDPESKYLHIKRPIPNGVIADLKGTRGDSSKIILLRADIDALPVQELADVPFKSANAGVMHACGHDGHAAMLMGAVKLLVEVGNKIDGTVRFLFQHAEELPPGGMKEMLAAGCAEGVTMAFSMHIMPVPSALTGTVLVRNGVMFNSADQFTIHVIGKGGHSSMPELAIDPISISATVITSLHSMVTRRLPSNGAPVLTVSAIHSSSTAFNVIPDDVALKCSLRCDNATVRANTMKYVEEVVAGVTQSMGATYELIWEPSIDITFNESNAFHVAERALKQVLPSEDKIVYMVNPFKGSEDFSFMSEVVPSNYIGIGSYNPEAGCTAINHSPKFMIDEECFKVGVKAHYGMIHETLMQ